MPTMVDLFSGSHVRIAAGMSVVKCARALLTILAVMISAGYFGATLERDAWVLGCSAVALVTQIIFGPLNETFRIKFLHIQAAEGEQRAQESTAALLKWVVTISVGMALVVGIYPNLMIYIFAPGFSADQQVVVAHLLAAYFPSLILAELIVMLSSVLNAYRSYYLPEAFAIAGVALNIVIMISTAKFIGIYSLVVSAYLSQGILTLILLHALRKRKICLWNAGFASWKTVSPYFWFGMPLYLSYLAGQFHAVIERRLCTLLGEGSVSILDYGRKFIELPMGIVIGVATSVVAPMLVRQVSDKAQFSISTLKFVNLFFLGLFPFCALLIVFPEELVQLVLMHGVFKVQYVPVTAETVRWFGVGALGLPLYVVCGQALMACQRRAAYVGSSIAGILVSTALNLIAYRTFGIATMAMSWALTSIVAGSIMLSCVPGMIAAKNVGRILPPLMIAALMLFLNMFIRSSRDTLHRALPLPCPPAVLELSLAGALAAISLALYFVYYHRQKRAL